MKQRNHTALDNSKLKQLARPALRTLALGLTTARRNVFGKHATEVDAHSVIRTENALPWVVKPHNRSPKRMARLKHALTVVTLQNA